MDSLRRLISLSAAVIFAIDLFISFRFGRAIKTELSRANGVLTRPLTKKLKRATSISITLILVATMLALIANFIPTH